MEGDRLAQAVAVIVVVPLLRGGDAHRLRRVHDRDLQRLFAVDSARVAGLGVLQGSIGLVVLQHRRRLRHAFLAVADHVDRGIHLVALGRELLLQVIDDALQHGVVDVQLAIHGADGVAQAAVSGIVLHEALSRVALVVGDGGVVVLLVAVVKDVIAILVLVVPKLEGGLAARDGGLVHIGFRVLGLGVVDVRVHLGQAELAVHALQLDGVVPAPCRILVRVARQRTIDIHRHHEGGPGRLVLADALGQQLLEVVLRISPDFAVFTAHIFGNGGVADTRVFAVVPLGIFVFRLGGRNGFPEFRAVGRGGNLTALGHKAVDQALIRHLHQHILREAIADQASDRIIIRVR